MQYLWDLLDKLGKHAVVHVWLYCRLWSIYQNPDKLVGGLLGIHLPALSWASKPHGSDYKRGFSTDSQPTYTLSWWVLRAWERSLPSLKAMNKLSQYIKQWKISIDNISHIYFIYSTRTCIKIILCLDHDTYSAWNLKGLKKQKQKKKHSQKMRLFIYLFSLECPHKNLSFTH